jgi:hypothetical protein
MSSIRRAVLVVLAAAVGLTAVATPSTTQAAPGQAQGHQERAKRHWQTVLKFKGVKAQACIASESSGYHEYERVDARDGHADGHYTSKVIEGGWDAGGGRIPFYPGSLSGAIGLGPIPDLSVTTLKVKIRFDNGRRKKASVLLSTVRAC